jgi:hypothetical protein
MTKVKQAKKQSKQWNVYTLIMVVLFISITICLLSPERSKSRNQVSPAVAHQPSLVHQAAAPFTHHQVSSDDASEFYKNQIIPILVESKHDSIPGVKALMNKLLDMVKAKKVVLRLSGYPSGASLAYTKPPKVGNVFEIVIIVPRLMDYRDFLNQEDFRDLVLTTFCHETVHLLYDPFFTQKLYENTSTKDEKNKIRLNGESIVCAITCEKVLIPMLQSSRKLPLAEIDTVNEYIKTGRNYKNPVWIEYIRRERFTPIK